MLVAVARASEWPPAMRSGTETSGAFAIVCAAIALAGAVRAGKSTTNDAHSNAHSSAQSIAHAEAPPVRASAVVAAKLALLLVMTGVFVAATLVTQAAWGLPLLAFDAAPVSACLAMAMLILGVAIVASATKGAKGAVLAVTAAVAVSILGMLVAQLDQFEVDARTWLLLSVLMTAGAAILFWRLYRGRSRTLPARLATMAYGSAVLALPLHTKAATAREEALSTDKVTLTIPLTGAPRCANGTLVVPVLTTAPLDWQVNLDAPTLTVTLSDESSFETRSLDWSRNARTAMLTAPGSPSVRVEEPPQRGDVDAANRIVPINFELSPQDEARACGHVQRLRVVTGVRVTSGEVLMRIAVAGGARAEAAGIRLQLGRAELRDGDVDIAADVSLVAGDPYSYRAHVGGLSFSLLDRTTGATRVLATSYRGGDASSSGFSALPGLRNVAYSVMLTEEAFETIPLLVLLTSRGPYELVVSGRVSSGFGRKQFETAVAP